MGSHLAAMGFGRAWSTTRRVPHVARPSRATRCFLSFPTHIFQRKTMTSTSIHSWRDNSRACASTPQIIISPDNSERRYLSSSPRKSSPEPIYLSEMAMLQLAWDMERHFVGAMPPLPFLEKFMLLKDGEKPPSGKDVRTCFQKNPIDKVKPDIYQRFVRSQ